MGIQLYGHIVDSMVDAAVMASEAKPDLIDLNFGCPGEKNCNPRSRSRNASEHPADD